MLLYNQFKGMSDLDGECISVHRAQPQILYSKERQFIMMKRVKTYKVSAEASLAFSSWLEENGIVDYDVYNNHEGYDYFEIEANEKTHEEIGNFLTFELDEYMGIVNEEPMMCETY
jgi:hypothetical protein